ncbi:MAG: trehalase family glycosidase, partial [Flammeovirgaceae bacterium]
NEPKLDDSGFKSDRSVPIEEHIEKLWPILTKENKLNKGTFIGLPHPYVVPGGRFQEMYYWDSYFTMLGLVEAGKIEQAK